MFDFLSEGITDMLVDLKIINKESYFEVEYVIINILHNVLTIGCLWAIGAYLKCISEVVVVSIVFNLYRAIVGGYHASTLDRCFVLTLIVIPLASVLAKVGILGEYSHEIAIASILVVAMKGIEILVNKKRN